MDKGYRHPGGLMPTRPRIAPAEREVYLFQRKTSKIGESLGKTTGWIHRSTLKQRNVAMINGVAYTRIDDQGLHISIDGKDRLLDVDHVVICAGQVSNRELAEKLQAKDIACHVIGGAEKAAELDAKYAIREGSELAARL